MFHASEAGIAGTGAFSRLLSLIHPPHEGGVRLPAKISDGVHVRQFRHAVRSEPLMTLPALGDDFGGRQETRGRKCSDDHSALRQKCATLESRCVIERTAPMLNS